MTLCPLCELLFNKFKGLNKRHNAAIAIWVVIVIGLEAYKREETWPSLEGVQRQLAWAAKPGEEEVTWLHFPTTGHSPKS